MVPSFCCLRQGLPDSVAQASLELMVYLCLLSDGILGKATVFICCLCFQIFLGLPYGNRVPVLAFVVWPVTLGEVGELE